MMVRQPPMFGGLLSDTKHQARMLYSVIASFTFITKC